MTSVFFPKKVIPSDVSFLLETTEHVKPNVPQPSKNVTKMRPEKSMTSPPDRQGKKKDYENRRQNPEKYYFLVCYICAVSYNYDIIADVFIEQEKNEFSNLTKNNRNALNDENWHQKDTKKSFKK